MFYSVFSASSIRKSSSLTSSSSAILTASNNIMTGGSLKKESLANLHLMSASNESKAIDKNEIKQQIPVKLSSLSNLSKVSKKSGAVSSASATNAAIATSSASTLSGQISSWIPNGPKFTWGKVNDKYPKQLRFLLFPHITLL